MTLANELDAALFLCDAFTQLGLIHASLADTRLLTTPTLLSVLLRTAELSVSEARALLDEISEARNWSTHAKRNHGDQTVFAVKQQVCGVAYVAYN